MTFTHDLTSKYEANWLRWLSEFRDKPVKALEIGTFEGRSAIWFCRNILTHEHASLICVDTFQWNPAPGVNSRDRFEANTQEAGVRKKLEVREMSSEWLSLPPACLDWAYVDGNHTQERVLLDALLVWRSLKPGGIVIFDDYLLTRAGRMQVKMAVDAFLRVYANQLVLVESGYQVCVRRKE